MEPSKLVEAKEARTVAILYADPRGPYPKMSGVDVWDETRDARLYAGPHPVVAHPPCATWSKLEFCTKQQTADCAEPAVAAVRKWGGVLEQPKDSRMFEAFGLPKPGCLPDASGGVTIEVSQCDWGHVARKWTWLYLVGVRPAYPRMPRREPTHWCSGFRSSGKSYPANYKREGCAVPPGIKVCSAQQRRRTPPAFAEFLVALARAAQSPLALR